MGYCLCPNLVRLNGAYEAGLDLAKKIRLIIRPGPGLWVRSGYAKTWPTAVPNGNTTCSTSGPISTSFGPFRPFQLVAVFSQKKKKNKGRRREQKFRVVVEEAQILVAFETFFFSPALKLLVWVFETFQEVLL